MTAGRAPIYGAAGAGSNGKHHVSKVQKGGPENAKILLDSQIRESRSGNSAGFKQTHYLWPTSWIFTASCDQQGTNPTTYQLHKVADSSKTYSRIFQNRVSFELI